MLGGIMKTILKITMLVLLVTLLGACAADKNMDTAAPTATIFIEATSTSTIEPTAIPTKKPTQTSIPQTLTPTIFDLPTPSGKPDAYWEDIRIMPGAIMGEGDNSGYSFTIIASVEQIQDFYQSELSNLGWNLFASGQGTTDAMLLIFMKNSNTLTVSILPQSDGTMYVLLVKS
jgi:hypothetical protein